MLTIRGIAHDRRIERCTRANHIHMSTPIHKHSMSCHVRTQISAKTMQFSLAVSVTSLVAKTIASAVIQTSPKNRWLQHSSRLIFKFCGIAPYANTLTTRNCLLLLTWLSDLTPAHLQSSPPRPVHQQDVVTRSCSTWNMMSELHAALQVYMCLRLCAQTITRLPMRLQDRQSICKGAMLP